MAHPIRWGLLTRPRERLDRSSMASMNVTIGTAKRWHSSPPTHVVVEVGNRQVLACTGCAGKDVRAAPFDAVKEELGCARCRAFWRRTVKVPNS